MSSQSKKRLTIECMFVFDIPERTIEVKVNGLETVKVCR